MGWFSELTIERGGLRVSTTNTWIPFSTANLLEGIWGIALFVPALCIAGMHHLLGKPAPSIGFAPQTPRPWHLVWNAVKVGGLKLTAPDNADVVMRFEDTPQSAAKVPYPVTLNTNATDIRKSAVAAAFASAFGYNLQLDPITHVGPMVEKGEGNGIHDGQIVNGPCPPKPGKVYQRLVDTNDGERVYDLRVPCVGGAPVCVFVKVRPVDKRFENHNTSCRLLHVSEVFSPNEIMTIQAFNKTLGINWGGLDILRDRNDGRLYIVDVNTTDMGPPLVLNLKDRLKACRWLGAMLKTYCQKVLNHRDPICT